MISTSLYRGELKIGDLIWYQKDTPDSYGGEDIGYIKDAFLKKGIKTYKVYWLKSNEIGLTESEETKESIQVMPGSYIFPVCKT